MFENYPQSIISIFADFHDVPKVVVAERLRGRFIGQVVLPGIKIGRRIQLETMRDDIGKHTGVYISPPDRIIRPREPIYLTENKDRVTRFYYADVPRSLPSRFMRCSEPESLTQWKWETLSWLRKKMNAGLFPRLVFEEMIWASRTFVDRWVDDIPADTYNFPHAGLHRDRGR